MISLDSTTLAAYAAASTYDARAQAIVAALPDIVEIKVYNAGALVGSGTMAAPWATVAGPVITIGEISSFTVLTTGTPNPSTWYLRFESGTKWLRGSFGFSGSGADFTWSRPIWKAGQKGKFGTGTIQTPRFDVRFASLAPTEGADTAAISATAPVTNVWQTIPAQSLTVGVPFTLNLADYDPPNTEAYAVNAGGDTLPDGLTLDTSTGMISGTPTTAQTKSVLFDASSSAEADWLSRSTGDGVVWTHNFEDDAEVQAFRETSTDVSGFIRLAADGPTAASSSCLEIVCPQGIKTGETLLFNDNAAGFGVSSPVTFSNASGKLLATYSGNIETGTRLVFSTTGTLPTGLSTGNVTGGPAFTGTSYYVIKVTDTTGRLATSQANAIAGTAIDYANAGSGTHTAKIYFFIGQASAAGRLQSGSWYRPLSPLTNNGKASADDGDGITPRTWTAGEWRTGYYGHASEQARYSTWDGASDIWDGEEFWLQFWVKFPSNRWDVGQPNGKLAMIQCYRADTNNGELVMSSTGNNPSQGGYYAEDTNWLAFYTSYGSQNNSKLYDPQDAPTGAAIQPGYNVSTCKVGTNIGCWEWPRNEWVNVLIHVKPGPHSQGSGVTTANVNPAYKVFELDVWAVRASELASGYTRVYNKQDFWWLYGEIPYSNTSGIIRYQNVDEHPPAFNAIALNAYMNAWPAVGEFYHRYAQIIFSRQAIPCPTTL